MTAAEFLDSPHSPRTRPERLRIGVVNNMPDGALKATERQYAELLAKAATSLGLPSPELMLFSLPGVPRSDWGAAHVARSYRPFEAMPEAELDGLVVTGTEPRAASLTEESYWNAMTRLVDWAAENTASTIWSCLAAHAAVLHLDGVDRVPLAGKRFGVFDCVKAADHRFTLGLPDTMPVPHSRWNELREDSLAERGYVVLTRSGEAGVDLFAKDCGSLFLFFQGHPEYGAGTLLGEYRRDLGLFLEGQRTQLPDIPANYFDPRSVLRLTALAERAQSEQADIRLGLIEAFGGIETRNSWAGSAAIIYRNWLARLMSQAGRRGAAAIAAE